MERRENSIRINGGGGGFEGRGVDVGEVEFSRDRGIDWEVGERERRASDGRKEGLQRAGWRGECWKD